MGTIVSLDRYRARRKEEQEELVASLHRLFDDFDRIGNIAQGLGSVGIERSEDQERYWQIKAQLRLECSMAMSLNVRAPIMDRVRKFHYIC